MNPWIIFWIYNQTFGWNPDESKVMWFILDDPGFGLDDPDAYLDCFRSPDEFLDRSG